MTQIYTRPSMPSLLDPFPNIEQQKASYFPRETRDYSTYSDREREGKTHKSSLPLSPMSDHSHRGVPPVKATDAYQGRQEHSQRQPSREQLPSLSSLFGSATHPSKPTQSPFSDRQSPVFPSSNSLDGRHPATPVHPDRPFDGAYFQRPRAEHVERLGFPQPPRPSTSTVKPESPRYESRFTPVEVSTVQTPSSVSGWSPKSARAEYFPRDTSSSFRTHTEHLPPTQRSGTDPRPGYREGPHSTSMAPSLPPTPASTAIGDSTTVKDGLGPKIWTGTQFLPRFVRQAEVPGEGMCYFYDDGTHCKTIIDGEVVNAHWGVTKAGKPRKRLAIACITCREKKIKCDPDYPRCVQCEKFGRICKFKNAPRGGQGSPDTPPAEPEDLTSRPVSSSRMDVELFKSERREGSGSISPRQNLHRVSPDAETSAAKRQRTGYNDFTPVASEASPRLSVQEVESPAAAWVEPGANDHNLFREWQVNPYTARPEVVIEIVDVFFKSGPETASALFPAKAFKSWFLSSNVKSLDDLMVIYSVLALGSIFSTKTDHKALGAQYAAVSRYACDNRRFSIQLVQSRLILSLYYFAMNNPNDAWDYCGGSVRAASGLRLNVEFEKSDDAYLQTFPYGLNRHGYAECRRRTCWSCYLVDRFNGFCSGHFSSLHPDDVFLRLPCDANSFEAQAEVQNPFFDPDTPPIQNVNWTVGSIAYLINVATIWGNVMTNIYRSSQRPNATSHPSHAFYEEASRQLRVWHESLPSCYAFSPENLKRAADNGKVGIFMTMHTVYHTTAMKLNRYIRHSTLSKAQLARHISLAQQHAESLLGLSDTIASRRISPPGSPHQQSITPARFTSPFFGYSIVSAIDILTAKVQLATLQSRLASFSGAQAVLAELAVFWHSAKNQQSLVSERIRDLAELTTGRHDHGTGSGFKFGHLGITNKEHGKEVFEMRRSMEKTFPRDFDCVYA